LQAIGRIVEGCCGVDQPFDDFAFIVDRQLHGNERPVVRSRRRFGPDMAMAQEQIEGYKAQQAVEGQSGDTGHVQRNQKGDHSVGSGGGGDDGLELFVEIAAGQQNAAATAATDKTDVGSQSDNFPLVAATGVFLAQANHVAQMQFHIHRRHYSTNGLDILHWQNVPICPIMERHDRMALRR
jgi:hypothetical protein